MRKLFASEAKQGMSSPSIWDDLAPNQHASAEIEKLFGAKAAFVTPKPERLFARIIHTASQPRDIVLDSFLGSGTTAVAHKMGRSYSVGFVKLAEGQQPKEANSVGVWHAFTYTVPSRKHDNRARFYHEVCEAHLARIVRVDLKSEQFTYAIDERALTHARLMDGELLLVTNTADLPPEQVVKRYKSLAEIEAVSVCSNQKSRSDRSIIDCLSASAHTPRSASWP